MNALLNQLQKGIVPAVVSPSLTDLCVKVMFNESFWPFIALKVFIKHLEMSLGQVLSFSCRYIFVQHQLY